MLPDHPGTYLLVLRLSRAMSISVGKLGAFEFPAGWYTYAGSARGPGGLKARVSRHFRGAKACRWHIDYFRAHAELITVWYGTGAERRECIWARKLSRFPEASMPAPRFGASDCQCPTHLIHLPSRPTHSRFTALTEGSISRSTPPA